MKARRVLALVVAATLLALPLSACGKRNAPTPPSDQPQTYPGKYPSE